MNSYQPRDRTLKHGVSRDSGERPYSEPERVRDKKERRSSAGLQETGGRLQPVKALGNISARRC